MKRYFLHGHGFNNPLRNDRGKVRGGLLLALLIVVAVAGYIYYFTDLVRPGKENETQAFHSSLVRKPLPPRPKISAAADPSPLQQAETKKGSADSGHVRAIKQATDKKAQAAPAKFPGKGESAATAKRPEPAKGNPPAKTAETPSEPAKGAYTLQIGVYVTSKTMTTEKARLRKAGLNPVISKGPKKTETMNRLFIGEFENYTEAAVRLGRVRKVVRDAFILPEKSKYVLYAGSYFLKQGAENERNRLGEAGIQSDIRTATIPVSTFRLTAGNFQTRKSAEQEADRLMKQGIKASVIQSGI